MALYDTAANIINDVAVEVGLTSSADVYASTDANFIRLRTLLKSVGRGLILAHGWLQLTKEHTFTTTSASSYNLPADFQSMVDQTAWDRTTRFPMAPVSPQTWQFLKASQSGVVFTVIFKPSDTTIQLWPQPPTSGDTVAFEYRSRYWVRATASASPDKDAPTVNTDVIHIDVQLITRALKLAFMRSMGFDTMSAQMEFDAAFQSVRNSNVNAAPKLSLNGSPIEDRMINDANSPGTGFGYDGGGLF